MEDILDLYAQPYDSKYPVICLDERPCQLIGDVISPIPMKSGNTKKEHYEYSRNGTCCIFMAFEPLAGWRMACIKEHRTKVDYANFMKELAQQYPDAEAIRLVQDNLNTPYCWLILWSVISEGAFELAKRFEYHYTPKKGSWLNMAEIELSALSKQCLDRRIENIQKLADEVMAWQYQRNVFETKVRWRFNKDNAREKLQRHYLNLQN